MTSDVSALSGFVANGHQAIHFVSSAPSKIPYGGFSPVRLQTGCQPRPSLLTQLIRSHRGDLLCERLFRSRTCARRHSQLLTPHTRPVALGSASGYALRQPHRLLWPHPSFCHSPPVSLLCRWPSDWQKFPNLLCLSLIPCRRLYSGGPRTLPTSARRWLGLRPSCRVSATTLVRTPDYVRACLTKRQHSLNAAARNLASPALDRTFTAELSCVRSLSRTSAITT